MRCIFGDADFETMYITLARESLSPAKIAGEPLSGATFAPASLELPEYPSMPDAKQDVVIVTPVYAPTMQTLEMLFTMHRLWEAKDRTSFYAPLAGKVRAIVSSGHAGADAAMMDALPKTEIITCFGVGYDAIDVVAAKARKIAVTNTPDVLTDDVADLAIGLLIDVARRISRGDRFVRAGGWLKGGLEFGTALKGKKMGIVGLGRIGHATAKRAEAFGMEILYHGRRRQPEVGYRYYADLVGLARDSDFLVLTLPGGPETKNLITADVLAAVGPQGMLINVARGSTVDERALIAALKSGALGGAALDVFADEPRVPTELMDMDNVVLQPHVGSATHGTRAAMGQLVVDNLLAHFAGRPLLTRVA
jgi:lactate dehydrogenase-like 2-hydroxyacid dehydrogenase